ncbi:M1 family metallopeptidase, partial [candidate division WOR-3 bacterium]|nr:M1 family metallopeptidase [candidate division WOR-3 bacterium]
MKRTALLALALAATALAFLPGPEQAETKWLLPGLEPPALDAESSHTWDARFYRIDLDLPMTDGSMNARCGVWLTSRVPALDTVTFNFTRLVCDSVKRGGQHLDFYDSYLYLDVYLDSPLAEGDSTWLDIWYHRSSSTQNRGFYYYLKGSGSNRNHSVCYSMTEPEDARYWFPCWDEPWDKAEQGVQVNITVPDSFQACANGLLDSVTTGGGRKTHWWTHRYPVPTYLVNFNASRFAFIEQHALASATDSIPVYNYVWPEDSAAAVNSFSKVPDMIEFYSRPDRFGDYPFLEEKYGHVAVYPFSFGGMEHQTMTTVHRQWVTNGSESGIAHELGHMWYGDFVTCHDWREIWLNEGGASYLDPLWMHHYYGRGRFLQDMDDYAQYFFQADQQDRHPIYNPGLARLFDYGHTYCKAAWVNHMLRYVEKDTAFDAPGTWWETERAWLDSFAYGTSTTEDRKRIHELHTGLELDWFFDEWVFHAGFPDYTVNWFNRETTDGWELVVDVGQDNGSLAPGCFRMPVELMVTVNGTDTLLRWDIARNPQRDVFSMPGQVTGVVFDPGKWLLHKQSITSGIENEL